MTDSAEAIKTALIAAGCDTGDGSYVHAAMDSVIAVILAMQAERRGEATSDNAIGAMRKILPYLRWTISDESPSHHPTFPSAVAEFQATLEKLEAGKHAPIAGREPVAWLMEWRTQPNSPMPKNDQPLYSAAQLEAHAAEQVRAEREACAKIAEEMPHMLPMGEKHMCGLKGIDVAAAIRARGQV